MHNGTFSDDPVFESFLLGIITNVNADTHTVDIQTYRLIEELKNVPLFRDPGNLSLPQIEDAAMVVFDDRLQPAVIGIYPKFIKDGIESQEDYNLRKGELLLQSKRGGRFMMLNSGVIRLVNWLDQGLEIDEASGSFYLRTPSKKENFAGVIERSGYVKRKGILNIGTPTVFDLDNQESFIRKIGTVSIPGTLTDTDITGIELSEKRTEIKVPGSEILNLYQETIGTTVVKETAGIYTEELHSDTSLPLRKKTVHYDATGTTELIREEIDALGNIHLYISPLATTGVNIDALVPLIANFLSINITAIGSAKVNGTTVELNGNSDTVALVSKIILAFDSHTHTTTAPGSPTGTPIAPWSALPPGSIGSLTVKAS